MASPDGACGEPHARLGRTHLADFGTDSFEGTELTARFVDVTPSASRLTESLRDLGYDVTTALAELVDNSISAKADTVTIDFRFSGRHSYIVVSDNGHGMAAREVDEALRFGSRREYDDGDLGRFGLGLKTASLSQCRRVTVLSRRAVQRRRVAARTLDLDHVARSDRWQIFTPGRAALPAEVLTMLDESPGSIIVLQSLDRLFEGVNPDSGWAKRRMEKVAGEIVSYFGMVFHRFIEGSAADSPRLTIVVNGEKVVPWNPFAPGEEETQQLDPLRLTLQWAGDAYPVLVRPYILPPRAEFSSSSEFERLGGPNRWNRQQGFYIYRSDRLVQSGGWAGLRGVDEHTKLARVALDFPRSLDEAFKVNVPKMRVGLPVEIRDALTRRVNEVCVLADARYRRTVEDEKDESEDRQSGARRSLGLQTVGTALEAAAVQLGETATLDRLMDCVRHSDPELADELGF